MPTSPIFRIPASLLQQQQCVCAPAIDLRNLSQACMRAAGTRPAVINTCYSECPEDVRQLPPNRATAAAAAACWHRGIR